MSDPTRPEGPIVRSVIGDVHPDAPAWQVAMALGSMVRELELMSPATRPNWSTLSIGVAFPDTPSKRLTTLFAKVTDRA